MARKHTTPAMKPIQIGEVPPTNPEHGVIATSPATAPDAAPSVVALPSLMRSTTSQPSMAAAAAKCVFMNAGAAVRLGAKAEPALNPNQPNQRIPIPRSVYGRLWGGIASRGHPLRLPITSTAASAATP